MPGSDRIVSRIPIRRNGKVLGAYGRAMFKGPEQLAIFNARIRALEGQVEFYKRETETLKSQKYGLDSIIGESFAVQRLRAEIVKIAPLEIPVLIRGESGTGKELVAHALHRLSPRRDGPMEICGVDDSSGCACLSNPANNGKIEPERHWYAPKRLRNKDGV